MSFFSVSDVFRLWFLWILISEYNPDTFMAWSGVFENSLGSVLPQECAKVMLAFYKQARLDVGISH